MQLGPEDLSSIEMFSVTSRGRTAGWMQVGSLPRWEKPGNEVGGKNTVKKCVAPRVRTSQIR